MIVFLALSSLGVGFYVTLLVALYRDGRQRRRNRVELYRELELDRAEARASERRGAYISPNGGRPRLSDEVLWLPVTKVHWNPALHAAQPTNQTR